MHWWTCESKSGSRGEPIGVALSLDVFNLGNANTVLEQETRQNLSTQQRLPHPGTARREDRDSRTVLTPSTNLTIAGCRFRICLRRSRCQQLTGRHRTARRMAPGRPHALDKLLPRLLRTSPARARANASRITRPRRCKPRRWCTRSTCAWSMAVGSPAEPHSFYAVCARLMRRILVESGTRAQSLKRGGGAVQVELPAGEGEVRRAAGTARAR